MLCEVSVGLWGYLLSSAVSNPSTVKLPRRTTYLIIAHSSYAETPRVIWHLPPDTCPLPQWQSSRISSPLVCVKVVLGTGRCCDGYFFWGACVRGAGKCPARVSINVTYDFNSIRLCEAWRHPQKWKCITYCAVVKEGPSPVAYRLQVSNISRNLDVWWLTSASGHTYTDRNNSHPSSRRNVDRTIRPITNPVVQCCLALRVVPASQPVQKFLRPTCMSQRNDSSTVWAKKYYPSPRFSGNISQIFYAYCMFISAQNY